MKYILQIILFSNLFCLTALYSQQNIEHFDEYVREFNIYLYSDYTKANESLDKINQVTINDTNTIFRLKYYLLKWNFEITYGEIEASKNSLTKILNKLKEYDDNEKAIYYNAIAGVYSSYFMYDIADYYYKRTLALPNLHRNNREYISALNGVSDVYREKGEADSAKSYVLESIELLNNIHEPLLYGNSINFLANIYFSKYKPDSALHYIRKYHKESYLSNNYYCASYYNTLSYSHYLKGQFDSAVHYCRLSMFSRKNVRDRVLYYSGLNNLGEMFIYKGELDSAEYYLKLARDSIYISKKVGLLRLNSQHLYKLYELIDDQDKLKELEEYKLKLDSIHKSQVEKVNLITKLYQASEKLDESTKKNQDYELFIFILILLTILITFFIVFTVYYALRLKEVLKHQDNLINDKIDTLKKLEIEINNKNKLISILSHDLINPINSSMQLLNILKSEYNNIDENEKLEIILELSRASNNTYNLLKDILNWMKVSNDKIYNFEPTPTKIYHLIQNIYEHLYLQLENRSQKLINDLNRDETINIDPNLMSTILRNLISNASKYSPNGKNIKIYSKVKNGKYILYVEDEGFGMSEDVIKSIKSNYSEPLKTNNDLSDNSFGYGLILCKDFMKVHKGIMDFESRIEEGTIVSLIFDENILVTD